jgi:glycolate oxidase FAD binding subunit
MPSRVGASAESLDRAFAGESAHLSATVSAGLMRLNLTPRNLGGCGLLVDRARAIAEQRGGFLVVEEAPSDYKRTIDVFGRERGDIEIMRRLKHQFDPAGILAQGRFVGRI